jgi:outer membrane lipase/esterase
MLRSIVLAGGIVAFGALGAAASSLTDKYSSFWVFGDSLSDNGNLFAATGQPPFPYSGGRFSDGPVWNERILGDFTSAGEASRNFAFGGATAVSNGDPIPDLSLQIGIFGGTVPDAALGDRPLASVWFGANDILNAINAAASESETISAAVAAAKAVGAGVAARLGKDRHRCRQCLQCAA